VIKICYIIGQLGIGGAERQLYELVKSINRERFDPVVISLSQGGYWGNQIEKLKIQVIELRRRKSFEFTRLFELINILRVLSPHIVHTYMFTANSYGRVAAIIARVPIIIASERNVVEVGKDKNIFGLYIDKLLAPFTHGIICNSYKASEALVKRYSFNVNKIITVHNGFNGTEFSKKNSVNINRKLAPKVVGTVGRLYRQKNHRLFIDMAKIVLEGSGNENIRFVIIGEGELRTELVEYVKRQRLESKVVFTGERNDIHDLLQNMDVFVMTSLYEGMSNAIMEAMAAGLPVIATDVGGNSELVVNGETGFLCQSSDVKGLADKVAFLINNENEAKRMGDNGRKRILRDFTVEKMVKKTESIYVKFCNKKRVCV